MNKKELRILMREKRRNLNSEIKKKADLYISEKLMKIIDDYKSVAIFISMEDEIDTRTIIDYCFQNDIKISVPNVIGKRMIFVTINSYDDLELSDYGILEPVDETECLDIDLSITPLLSFNSELMRLGYGGGYYDRYFSNHNIYKLGIAYDFQYYEADIYNEHDVKLDEVVIAKTK